MLGHQKPNSPRLHLLIIDIKIWFTRNRVKGIKKTFISYIILFYFVN